MIDRKTSYSLGKLILVIRKRREDTLHILILSDQGSPRTTNGVRCGIGGGAVSGINAHDAWVA